MPEFQRNLNLILDTITDGVLVVDSLGMVLYANPAAERILDRHELVGKSLAIPIADGEKPQDINLIRHGGMAWAELRSAPIEWEGVLGYVIGLRDVTVRKKVEDELKRSNDELDQFAYAVSHDMREPLRMITSYLALIETSLAEKLDEDTRQYLRFAIDGAKRMDRMILAMLDFSRVGRKTAPMAAISSREVLDDALAILAPDIVAGATVEVTGDWPELAASRDELLRLLQNLIGNALKYHEPEQPPHVEIHAEATPALFRAEIRDHGIGIEPSQSGRLFKVFSRLQARARFDGTGVGLALCRRIVEHHGGRIGVESAGEGAGSTFWFELPRTHARSEALHETGCRS